MTDNTKTFLGLSALGAVLAWLMYDKDEAEVPKTIDAPHEVIEDEKKQLSGIKKEYRVVTSDDFEVGSFDSKKKARIAAKIFADGNDDTVSVYWLEDDPTRGVKTRGFHVKPSKKKLSGKSKKKGKLSGKITLNPEYDYTAYIFNSFGKSKKEIDRQNFKRSAEAYLWAKEQCEKNHHVAQIWQGHSNLLATYRWYGKTLKFQRV